MLRKRRLRWEAAGAGHRAETGLQHLRAPEEAETATGAFQPRLWLTVTPGAWQRCMGQE